MMEFDDREFDRNLAGDTDANRHFGLDGEVREIDGFEVCSAGAKLAREQSSVDGTAHPELFDDSGADTSDLVADDAISVGTAEHGDSTLHLVSLVTRHGRMRLTEIGTRTAPPVIAPLACRKRQQARIDGFGLQFRRHQASLNFATASGSHRMP
jgi:hypothetical protein